MMLKLEQYFRISFFELPKLINGLAVLVAEIPLARERIELGDIEFIADTILIMRHKVTGRLLRRELEIRKARGAPISVAKIYFTISEGYGIKAYIPLRLSEIPSPNISNIIRLPCREVEDFLYPIYAGETIYVSYPSHLFPLPPLLMAIAVAVANKAKLLVISYEASSEYIWHRITEAIKRYLKVDVSPSRVKDALKDYVVIEAYSPATYVSDELYYIALNSVQRIKPHTVAILGASFIVMGGFEEYIKKYGDLILNLMLYFRKLGITTIIFGSYQEDLYRFYTHVADIIIKTEVIKTENGEELEHIIARKGSPTMIAKDYIFNTCLEKTIKTIYSLAEYYL
uniref:KaiC-like domain-containing protein n=1 Tax=Ignisphaera aggregans TaxID=334771 RepID=A0A7C5TEL6_9CREN